MSLELELDKKLFANRGVIGRKDYIVNMSILFVSAIILTIPCVYWFTTTNYSFDFRYLNGLYYSAPFFMQTLLMFVLCTSVVIGISNIKRRLTDIFGKDIEVLKYLVSALYIICLFSFFLPLNIGIAFNGLFLLIAMFLMLKKGKISPLLKESAVKVQD